MADPRPSGASAVLGATVAAGVVGLVLNLVVARNLGPAPTAEFAAYWSAVYLIVAAAAGIQQEVTRAARPSDQTGRRVPTLRRFAILAAVSVGVVVAASAVFWAPAVFGDAGLRFVAPLTIAASGYVVAAVTAGVLFGLGRWRPAAIMVLADAVLRAIAVGVVSSLTSDIVPIAYAVSIPFGAAVLIVWPLIRTEVVGRAHVAESVGRLAADAVTTVVGSAGVAVLVSGYTLFFVASADTTDEVRVGAVAFSLILVRAPLVVTALASQGLLIVRFRDRTRAGPAEVLGLLGVLFAVTAVLAVLAAVIGDPLLALLAGPAFTIGPLTLALLVASSGLLAAMVVTGSICIARRRQRFFAAGWLTAAAIGIGTLWVPIDPEWRLAVSLTAAPIVGLAIHSAGLLVRRSDGAA